MTISKKSPWNKITIIKVLSLVALGVSMSFSAIQRDFFKIDLSIGSSIIGAFVMGPTFGILIEFIKTILSFILNGKNKFFLEEFVTFLIGIPFIYISSILYYKNKKFSSAAIGLLLGGLFMIIASSIANFFILFSLYPLVFELPIDRLIEMGTMINENIVDMRTMMIYKIIPLSVLKVILVVILTGFYALIIRFVYNLYGHLIHTYRTRINQEK